jgi:MFS transporter, ACS family, aldohexuronate transporter
MMAGGMALPLEIAGSGTRSAVHGRSSRGGHPWVVLAVVTVAHALGSFTILSSAPLAPFLIDGLGLTRAEVGLCLPAAYLGGVLMSLPAGWLTDRLGVRLTLGGGLGLIAGMVGLATLSRSLVPFLACLVIGGFGFSVLNPATGRAVVDWFPPRRRGVAMGIKQTGLTLGGVAAALVLPAIASVAGWRDALRFAALIALACAVAVVLAYRSPAVTSVARPAARPRIAELGQYLRRPGVQVVFACGLLLSVVQSSLLAYLALYAKETFALSAIRAGQLLALAQVGGTLFRLGGGFVSDRFFEGRRRPGIVISALVSALALALLSLGTRVPSPLVAPLALVAGAGAFGWVGLYFALVAEIGGARHAGLLTGVSVMFSWSGVLVGPPLFGLVLEATGSYAVSWLVLVAVAALVSVALPLPGPLVHRGPPGALAPPPALGDHSGGEAERRSRT